MLGTQARAENPDHEQHTKTGHLYYIRMPGRKEVMSYQRMRAAAAGQAQRIRAAAGEQITKAKKHPAGIAALYVVTIAEVGTMQAAVFGLKAIALAMYGMAGATRAARRGRNAVCRTWGRISPLIAETARKTAKQAREAWAWREELVTAENILG